MPKSSQQAHELGVLVFGQIGDGHWLIWQSTEAKPRGGAAELCSAVGYSIARSARTIEIRTTQESAERPAITTTDCAAGEQSSVAIGRSDLDLGRLWSTR
jgi:hypothetical protein